MFEMASMIGKKSRRLVIHRESSNPKLGGYLASRNIAYLCAQYMLKSPKMVTGIASGTASEKNTASKIIFIDYE